MGKLGTELVDLILSQSNILDVISQHVILKKSGNNNYKALCPFHKEKTPSFSISPDKQLYYCFGCGQGGNSINFLIKYRGYNFPEALAYLTDKFIFNEFQKQEINKKLFKNNNNSNYLLKNALRSSISLPFSWEKTEDGTSDENLLDFFNYLHKRFVGELDENLDASSYLRSRLSIEDILEYEIGYCPNNELYLLDFLNLKNAKTQKKIISNSGLMHCAKYGESSLLSNRITFPIKNVDGDVIGFSARTISNSKTKYINLAKSKVFDKSSSLLGIERIKPETTSVNLVEGPFDIIGMYAKRADEISVGLVGTAFTYEHAELLKELGVKSVNVITDSDTAGEKSRENIEKISLDVGLKFTSELLPIGFDPFSFYYKK